VFSRRNGSEDDGVNEGCAGALDVVRSRAAGSVDDVDVAYGAGVLAVYEHTCVVLAAINEWCANVAAGATCLRNHVHESGYFRAVVD
jgi:hypothetical protein